MLRGISYAQRRVEVLKAKSTMPRKVLIVEDEPDIARLVQTHLNDAGYQTDIAGNGAAAMKLFDKGGYQLVVLDLMLPDTDGLSLCRQMRMKAEYVAILLGLHKLRAIGVQRCILCTDSKVVAGGPPTF